MTNKLFHNRIFAVVACLGFALVFVIAGNFRSPAANSPVVADALVTEEAPVQSSKIKVPAFKAVPLEPLEMYAKSEFDELDPILARESQDERSMDSTTSSYPLIDETPIRDEVESQQPRIRENRFEGSSSSTSGFRPRNTNGKPQGQTRVARSPSILSLEQEETRAQVPTQTASGSSEVPAFLPSASGSMNLTSKPDPGSAQPVTRSVSSSASNPVGSSTKEPAPSTKPGTLPPKKPLDGNTLNPGNFRLAAQPKEGGAFHPHNPETDSRAWLVESNSSDFHPGPIYDGMVYDPYAQMNVYEGKTLNATQRPLLELGRPWYQLGQLSEGYDFLGKHNPVTPQLVVFGDFRTAYASNKNADGTSDSLIASEWNMNWDLRLTSTERFAWFLAPLNDGESNTRYELDNDRYVDEWNPDVLFGYFEGDLGALVGGAIGQTLPFDLPFAVGVMPLLFQNGVWLEDQFLGVAATIPARHSTRLGISNMDITFFAGFDEILSPAFDNEDDVGKLYGIASFIEANNGYWEIDYAYLEDRNSARDRSYHNIGIGYTRRYGRWISNSTRIIVNAGQSTDGGPNTADGVLLLSENSLITAHPSSIIPYFNFFAGFDRPQKAAGNNVLKNTGILFESDGMTGFPTLDASAQNTYGGAIGLNMLPKDFSQQLVLETAFLGVMGDRADRNAVDDQYGVGARYQLPLNNSMILRADAMYGFLRNSSDINGVRVELRRKF